ncbi:MAG: phage coat protein [Oscillospiraceae bacterium]
MANTKFDAKSFNPEAFRYLTGRIPNLKMNEIKKSRALAANPDIAAAFAGQDGAVYARLAMRGLLDGDAVNYDGVTDITATSTKTFERGVVAVGRAKGWVERDFSYDVTGGIDFMQNIASQVAEYKDGLDEDTILAVLSGVFAMTGTKNLEFTAAHTTDICDAVEGKVNATSLNTATNKACGANKKKFTLIFMHPDVSTNLENLNLIEHLKYTDKDGVQRDLDLGTWNGKLVVIDDDMPTEALAAHYIKSKASDKNALKVVLDSATPAVGEIKVADTGISGIAAGDYVFYVEAGTKYTSFALGDGSLDYVDIGAKVPFEMAREASKNGGQDTLYMRQRHVFAPFGISYEKTAQATQSPTDAELKNGANWTLVNSGETSDSKRTYINHKAIPICRIISRG